VGNLEPRNYLIAPDSGAFLFNTANKQQKKFHQNIIAVILKAHHKHRGLK
tara:strand:+ start:450 stop:599 length:150 start_codon:yes stop_codon:yes gene_type:complete